MSERIWDRFLTEKDREHLARSTKQSGGFGSKPALLFIDLYRGVFGDREEPLLEAIKSWPGSCGPAAWRSLPFTQKLLAAGREAGIPVLHVTGLHEDDAGMPGWMEGSRRSARRSMGTDAAAIDRNRRKYDIVEEVAPRPGELVLRKSAPSAFWGTPLAGELVRLGVDTLIVAGESTSGCVRASVVEGASYRYRMVVVEECVFDRHEAPHAINLFDMDQKYATVIPLEKALEHLRGLGAGDGVSADLGQARIPALV